METNDRVEAFKEAIKDFPIDDLTRNSIVWIHTQALTTHEREVREKRTKILQSIYDSLPTTAEREAMARGWGKEGTDRYEGFVDGAKEITGRVAWAIYSVPDCGVVDETLPEAK